MKLIVKHISIITYPIPVITRYTHNLPPVASIFWATRWTQGHSLKVNPKGWQRGAADFVENARSLVVFHA